MKWFQDRNEYFMQSGASRLRSFLGRLDEGRAGSVQGAKLSGHTSFCVKECPLGTSSDWMILAVLQEKNGEGGISAPFSCWLKGCNICPRNWQKKLRWFALFLTRCMPGAKVARGTKAPRIAGASSRRIRAVPGTCRLPGGGLGSVHCWARQSDKGLTALPGK